MKVYKDVTDILNQNGVSWDETVRANDVWEAYFKEHPDAISYQGTILENYSNLCLISAHLNRKRSNRLRIKLETSNNALGMKGDDKSENLQSPARRKRKPKSLSTSIYSIKSQRTFKNERQETFEKKPDTVKTMFSNEDGKYYNSIETIVAALQTVSDMDDELFLEACELLEDERKAKMFVAMDVTARRKWLLKKLNR
ncbi:L10-interacting MYB domain-containing protein [Quillaja saponaria]|uniref:L10-interacting MYB domain-containing protein n=1 Tax=Quillaja saponaria TaxID=32244 RepID=A0AAD7QAL2_QUISA|nr:L10-interacting MYB domain-containing protein [Quillaja saponaria]